MSEPESFPEMKDDSKDRLTGDEISTRYEMARARNLYIGNLATTAVTGAGALLMAAIFFGLLFSGRLSLRFLTGMIISFSIFCYCIFRWLRGERLDR